MESLRQETRAEHLQIESLFRLDEILCSRDAYLRLVERLTTFYSALEKQDELTAAWAAISLDADKRRKSGLLTQDLELLGGTPTAEEPILPRMTQVPCTLGCLYVTEGSTLGGQIIAKAVKKHLGSDTPCSFFSGYGKSTAAMWREFGAGTENYYRVHGGQEDILAGARSTFASLGAWLEMDNAI